jgi:hypothetical protein
MDDEPEISDDIPPDDPELAALLNFEPVPRRQHRENSWTPANQRTFIRKLALTGDPGLAAAAVGLTANGAYQLRRDPAGKDFLRAWQGATALYRRRKGIARGPAGRPPAPPPAPATPTQADLDAHWDFLCETIFEKYVLKLLQERQVRLAGRIVEADFYVRQLTWLEVALDLGGLGERAVETLKRLNRGALHAGRIVATPMSLLCDRLRRAAWAEMGEPDRPPPPELGPYPNEDFSTGPPSECQGGVFRAEREAQERQQALQAEAQALWEAKARADVAAWRERLGLPPLGDEDAD